MIANQQKLTNKQIHSFDWFLLESTSQALRALESMFALNIESSNSSIELMKADDGEIMKRLGGGALYTVTCALAGDIEGSALLLMRSGDFENLGKVMRPVLTLLYLSSPGTDLEILDSQMSDWMQNDEKRHEADEVFQEQMLDMLAEMGNVFIGLYTRAIYRVCNLNAHHSVPHALRDPGQQVIKRVLSPTKPDILHLVIENEFFVTDKPVKLWCVISPKLDSLQDVLAKIEYFDDHQDHELLRIA